MKTSRLRLVIFPLVAVATSAQIAGTNVDAHNPSAETALTPATASTAVVPAAAPMSAGEVQLPAATGETSVTLDIGFGIRAVPPSRVTVPVGERLRIVAPNLGEGGTYIWTKNGRALPDASGNQLVLDYVVSADAGTYAWQFSTPATLPRPSQSLVLGVGPTDRLLNLSTRANIGGGAEQGLVSGFAVQAGAQPKKLILRAVGPSLAMFGVTTPLAAPVLRIFDSNGQPYTNGYVYPAVVGGPTYETDLAESLARTGAFPLPAGTRDAVAMMPFPAGNYTAQVTSGDGTAGTVLLEIYEVP